MEMTGAKILLECLLEQGVDTVFGYPGGTILNVYDELYHYQDKITHILTAHEQGAAHAADGYARSTGKVGVCFATSGPGACNLTTGIATAYMDSSPVVFISCNVPQALIGKDAFQEVDITGITMPITKCTYLIRDVNDLADAVREAFALARSGRPGPVMIDIVKDVTAAKTEFEYLPREKHATSGRLAALMERARTSALKMPEPDQGDINKLVEMIAEAKKPMLICGGGVVRGRAHEEFREFARRIDAPVAITLMGGGGISGTDPLATGMIGMHGSKASNMACDGCDLLIAVGCRFSDRVALKPDTFARNAKIVHIDIDRAEINKNVSTTLHITGDARTVLDLLLSRVSQKQHPQWMQQARSMVDDYVKDDKFEPRKILKTMAEIAPGMTVATDVGQHQMWTAQHFPFIHPRQLISSGGLGTMGFGLGAAMGAAKSDPEGKPVALATGDGSFRMNLTELSTIGYYNIPVIVVIFNNGTLGMVRQWQTLFFGQRYSQTTLDRGPDFIKLADAYGLEGTRVSNLADFRAAFEKAYAACKPCLIECMLDIDEMVAPMVAPGSPIDSFCLN